MNMQELRVESADGVLCESSLQIHSQRMEFYLANQSSDYSRREEDWLFAELEEREKEPLNNLVLEFFRKWKNWKSWFCSRFKFRTCKTKWALWTVPGLSVILRQQAALGYPTFRGLVDCLAAILASRLIHGTHFGISGNVCEDLPAPSEPSAAFFGNSRSPASAQCEPVSLNTGRLTDRANE